MCKCGMLVVKILCIITVCKVLGRMFTKMKLCYVPVGLNAHFFRYTGGF